MKKLIYILYTKIGYIAIISFTTAIISDFTLTLHANQRASKSDYSVPEIPKRENELFLKILMMMKKDREAALELILDSVDEDNSAALYFLTGDLLQKNGYTVDALEHFHMAIDKYPNFFIALRSAGIIETHLKNFDEARELLLRAYELKSQPDHIVLGSLGHCHVGTEEFQKAEQY